jgi:GTP-binding protein Era
VVALLVDAQKGVEAEVEAIVSGLSKLKAPAILVLNKIDTVERSTLLKLTADLNVRFAFRETFMISALTRDGLPHLKKQLAAMMPVGPWLYPEDQVSDAPLRLLAAEITREKLFERLHDELPYQLTVETDSWKELPDGSARIEQTIYVVRDGQKKIVIGEGGRTIKAVGQAARADIAEAAEHKVHLFLFVKVRPDWADDPERYREMGLEFPRM